jgi:AcrR family transcriptional regulator
MVKTMRTPPAKRRPRADQLSAIDWLDQGLKTLTKSGFTALKAEPMAKAMGVSRGSFYWHFEDVAAFHTALLRRWRETMTEQIIASLERLPGNESPINELLRRAFGGNRLPLEIAVRSWATVDPVARAAVHAIDRRRLSYMEAQFAAKGFSPGTAQARSQILYWAFLGFTLSDKPLSKARQDEILDELIKIANAPG